METTESIKLVIQVRNGNGKAFNQLVKGWYQKIYNYSYKFFGDHDQAMEITQKTFITVHQNFSKLNDPAAFKSWLYQIAINFCKEETRKSKRKWLFPFVSFKKQDNLILSEIKDATESPVVNMEQADLNQLIVKALAKLPDEQRTVVIMKEYEGLKFREIAKVLGISENTVKSRMYYGLKHLREIFELWNLKKENTYYEH